MPGWNDDFERSPTPRYPWTPPVPVDAQARFSEDVRTGWGDRTVILDEAGQMVVNNQPTSSVEFGEPGEVEEDL